MVKISSEKVVKKIIQFSFVAILVLAVVFFDPKGDILKNYQKNYSKSEYFENCIPNNGQENNFVEVAEVTDGDTITINNGCKPVTVRLLGIDTPETVDPRKPVQCFGKQASAFTKSQLTGKMVKIEEDEKSGTYDKYGRTLGYVILEDGTNFNQLLIEDGYAHEYTYNNIHYKYQQEFKDAEKYAKENQIGLWNSSVCPQ